VSDDVVWRQGSMGMHYLEPASGRAAVVEAISRGWLADLSQSRHFFLNLMLTEVGSNRAVVHAYVLHTATDVRGTRLRSSGIYRLELGRIDGDWLMARIDAGYDGDPGRDGEGLVATHPTSDPATPWKGHAT
jgi:hypothetical protein